MESLQLNVLFALDFTEAPVQTPLQAGEMLFFSLFGLVEPDYMPPFYSHPVWSQTLMKVCAQLMLDSKRDKGRYLSSSNKRIPKHFVERSNVFIPHRTLLKRVLKSRPIMLLFHFHTMTKVKGYTNERQRSIYCSTKSK